MNNGHIKYRGFDIEVGATASSFAGLWIGHYDISLSGLGVASAFLSGPHKSQVESAENALRIAKKFVDEMTGSGC